VELERSRYQFRDRGLKVAAISYDSREALSLVARRLRIHYPLLSDPDSEIIRAFGILNTNIPKGHEWYGIPFPGTYVVDEKGIVRSKYFEEGHRQRFTADTVLAKEFGVGGGERQVLRTPHLTLVAWPSQDRVRPGNRIALVLEVQMPPRMHVYAPGVEGYRPVSLRVEESPALRIQEARFPPPEILLLPAIRERVPVYQGTVRITRDVTVSPRFRGPELEVPAEFSYQACDDRVCYPPTKVPLRFKLGLEGHDRERVPEALRRKGSGR
jgi:hypothetical protein